MKETTPPSGSSSDKPDIEEDHDQNEDDEQYDDKPFDFSKISDDDDDDEEDNEDPNGSCQDPTHQYYQFMGNQNEEEPEEEEEHEHEADHSDQSSLNQSSTLTNPRQPPTYVVASSLKMSEEDADRIKSIMASIPMPQMARPEWSRHVPDAVWMPKVVFEDTPPK